MIIVSLITFGLVHCVCQFVDVQCELLRLSENFKVLFKTRNVGQCPTWWPPGAVVLRKT